MTSPLVRVPLTLTAAIAFHVSMSPPSTSDSYLSGESRATSTTARWVRTLTKGLFWGAALTDTLVSLAPYIPAWSHTITSTILPFLKPLWTPLAATTLALAGAYLRYAAYDALGQFYACTNRGAGPCVPISRGVRTYGGETAPIMARGHAHALITTGPYAYLRHPGCTGLILCTTGLVVLQLDVITWCGAASWGGDVGAGASVVMRTVALGWAVVYTLGAVGGIGVEEQWLRERFKMEWEEWAENVRYKLVLGVY